LNVLNRLGRIATTSLVVRGLLGRAFLSLWLLDVGHILGVTKILLSLLHLDLLLLIHLRQHTQSVFVVATIGQLTRHLDLLLHFLRVMHNEDGENALRLNLLAVGTV